MQPATGRDIIYRTQGQNKWQEAVAGYHRSVEDAQYRLNEMKKPNSKWGYHRVSRIIKEFPAGQFENGFTNLFSGCQTSMAIQFEEMAITSQVASRFIEELVKKCMNEEERPAVLKFLRKKAKDKTHGEMLEFYPASLKKFFSKIQAGQFKSPEHKATYRRLKDEINSKLAEMSTAGAVVIDAFLEHKQRINLGALKHEVMRRIPHVDRARELLSWVEDVIRNYPPAYQREAIIQLIMSPKKDPSIVALLDNLHQSRAFAECEELNKFFAAWGQLLVDASPTFNGIYAINEEYRARRQDLDRQTGCVSLPMQFPPPITLELCNAFLRLGGKAYLAELPKK